MERLEALSKENKDFQINFSDEWITKGGGQIIDMITIENISDYKTIEKYDKEIQNAVESWMNFLENEERLLKSRTKKSS